MQICENETATVYRGKPALDYEGPNIASCQNSRDVLNGFGLTEALCVCVCVAMPRACQYIDM